MLRSRHLLVVPSLYGLLFLFLSCASFGQNVAPLEVELVQHLDAKKIKVGDSIFAKTHATWDNDACYLRTGSIIQGRVVTRKEHSKTEKKSEIGIAFESGQCNGREMTALFLTVAAIVGPSHNSDQTPVEEMQPLSSAVGVTLNGNLSRQGSTRSISQAADTTWYEPRQIRTPDTLKPGQVVGIAHLSLGVGQGEGGASILSSTGHNVWLDKGTTFVMVPNLRAESASATNPAWSPDGKSTEAGGSTDKRSTDKRPADKTGPEAGEHPAGELSPKEDVASDLADETELCVAPDCTVTTTDARFDETTHGAQMTWPLKGLGYMPPAANHEMASFDYNAGIAYLGPSQFLFTFNPHTLVSRSGAEAITFRKLHLIRAMLIDLEKNAIVKTVDWRVPDSGRYLWPVGQDKVLVHVGEELRIYGPGLKLLNQVFLGGQLAFVRLSPSSDFIAVGIVHERHTHLIHQQLEEAEAREPEEDLEVRLFDSQFKVVTTVTRSSRTAPPILMNEGEVHIRSLSRDRWQFIETSWAGQQRVIARATSSCPPQGESLPGNLLFLSGCDRPIKARWYRILHGDGKVVLKGASPSTEMAQTAGGNVGDHAFAVRIAEAATSRLEEDVFTPADLKSVHVTIYSAKNGRRLFSIHCPDPIPSVQTFAISPHEDQFAILTANEIAFYRLSHD